MRDQFPLEYSKYMIRLRLQSAGGDVAVNTRSSGSRYASRILSKKCTSTGMYLKHAADGRGL
uniref:Uncharacterized protein n=1 Tax=Meloidogyne incognita TaxID=6306 RepID=A0A914NX13_MELIC